MDLPTSVDTQLFLLINHLPHSDLANSLALLLSGIGQWGAVWFVIALYLFFREEKRDHWFFVPFFLSMGLGAVLSELVIKLLVLRLRPEPSMGAIVVSAADNYSFPSTHATLAVALAYVLSKEEPKYTALFYFLAIAIGLSRIYLGVHYPGDVLGGALLGTGIGYGAFFISRQLATKIKNKSRKVGKIK